MNGYWLLVHSNAHGVGDTHKFWMCALITLWTQRAEPSNVPRTNCLANVSLGALRAKLAEALFVTRTGRNFAERVDVEVEAVW